MENRENLPSNVYLNGLGLGSIAAAMYLIQKADFNASNIHIFEQKSDQDFVGGSCDASKRIVNGQSAYFMQGSRMFEDKVPYSLLISGKLALLAEQLKCLTRACSRLFGPN